VSIAFDPKIWYTVPRTEALRWLWNKWRGDVVVAGPNLELNWDAKITMK
jgi:hypothetical protein